VTVGRTNPTFRDFLDRYEDDWSAYRRGLRRQHKPDFDRLFERARQHADAGGYMNAADPEIAFLVSVLLAQAVELRELRERLADGESGQHLDEGASEHHSHHE
jgi:transposase